MPIEEFNLSYIKDESNTDLLKRINNYLKKNANNAILRDNLNSVEIKEYYSFSFAGIKLNKTLHIRADVI